METAAAHISISKRKKLCTSIVYLLIVRSKSLASVVSSTKMLLVAQHIFKIIHQNLPIISSTQAKNLRNSINWVLLAALHYNIGYRVSNKFYL